MYTRIRNKVGSQQVVPDKGTVVVMYENGQVAGVATDFENGGTMLYVKPNSRYDFEYCQTFTNASGQTKRYRKRINNVPGRNAGHYGVSLIGVEENGACSTDSLVPEYKQPNASVRPSVVGDMSDDDKGGKNPPRPGPGVPPAS